MFYKVLARRASPTLHCYIHRRTHSSKAPLSILDKLPEPAPPLCRRLGKNQQKAQQRSTFLELSVGQAEDCLQSLGKDAPVPLGKAEFQSVKVSVSKPSRSKKGESRKQKLASHGNVKENGESNSVYMTDSSIHGDAKENAESHSVYVTDSSINVKLSASKADVELVACRVESSSQDPKNYSYHVTKYESKVSTTECGGKLPSSDRTVLSGFNASEICAFEKGNGSSRSGDPLEPLTPLKAASHKKLLRKAKLVEGLAPTEVAKLLKKRAFKSCSFEQLETMLQFLEEYHASSERALKVLLMNPGVLSHSVDLLQQKLQVFNDFQIAKETVSKLCSKVSVLATSLGSLQAKLELLEELGLDVEAKNKLFYRAPCAIAFSPQGLKRTLEFLSGVGVNKERFVRFLWSCPQLLWVSCDRNLIPRYHFFQQIGIPDEHLPRLICFSSRSSVDTIRARIQSLKELGFSHEDVCFMVRKAPELLRSKVERLKVALDYLVHEQKYDMAEIVKFPRCLLCSLECRIIPRCRLAEEHGLFKVYSLASILSYPEARFKKLLREDQIQPNHQI